MEVISRLLRVAVCAEGIYLRVVPTVSDYQEHGGGYQHHAWKEHRWGVKTEPHDADDHRSHDCSHSVRIPRPVARSDVPASQTDDAACHGSGDADDEGVREVGHEHGKGSL